MQHSEEVRVLCSAEYLKHVRDICRRIRTLREEIDEQRSFVELTGISLDERVASSVAHDKQEKVVIELINLIRDYTQELLLYVQEQRDAHNRLEQMEDSLSTSVLKKYYLMGKSWEEICVDVSYSYAGMMKLRRKALISFYDYLPEEYRRYSIPNAQPNL